MKNCESFSRLERRDEEVGLPPRLRSNEARRGQGRSPQGRSKNIPAKPLAFRTKTNQDFSLQSFSTVS
jgi:hypothetical protein